MQQHCCPGFTANVKLGTLVFQARGWSLKADTQDCVGISVTHCAFCGASLPNSAAGEPSKPSHTAVLQEKAEILVHAIGTPCSHYSGESSCCLRYGTVLKGVGFKFQMYAKNPCAACRINHPAGTCRKCNEEPVGKDSELRVWQRNVARHRDDVLMANLYWNIARKSG